MTTLEKLAQEFRRNAEIADRVISTAPPSDAPIVSAWKDGYQEGMRAAASICLIEAQDLAIREAKADKKWLDGIYAQIRPVPVNR